MRAFQIFLCIFLLLGASAPLLAQRAPLTEPQVDVRARYVKTEVYIPMRDGKKLFTSIYAPKDATRKYPIMLCRTPYSVAPYGRETYKRRLGPSQLFAEEGYIFVYQDVRGKFLSEGEFEDVRPFNPNKKTAADIDEASDTYDTIEWLLKNVPSHNGRVGMWGISYPGFYVTMGILSGHPALKAASPQAPVTDWFIGDDDHHNGALFVLDAFSFNASFGLPRPKPTTEFPPDFEYGTPDAYKFYLDVGPVANLDRKYLKGRVVYWNDLTAHGTYDEFWKARTPLPHLKNLNPATLPAVLTVGGWFDAEDLYGPLNVYATIERGFSQAKNNLVMGPWFHGGWAGSDGERLGWAQFAAKTSVFYRENVELPFFNFHLKDKGTLTLPEAWIFQTGSNQWKTFDQWPPKNGEEKALYLRAGGKLSFAPPPPDEPTEYDEYVSDPRKPVPYTNEITNDRGVTYMVEDQRFVATRPDVMVYQSDVLTEDVTIAGPILANLIASTSGTDSDFIVKLIDVHPDAAPKIDNVETGGWQMLVRWEVMRGKFRNSYEKPEPFTPNEPTKVSVPLQDAAHTFLKGHRIMVQVQSTMFPLIDRNPQTFTDIYHATDADFQKATQRIYRSARRSSHLSVTVLK
jgi:uncharacterized protein